MKKILFIIGFLGLNIIGYSQTTIDSIKIYNYFKIGGYTTAGAFGQFKQIDTLKTDLILIPKSQVDSINLILNNSKQKKLMQQKYGMKNVFMIFYIQGIAHKVVYSFDSLIIDFTDNRHYWITKYSDIVDLKKMITNYNTEYPAFNRFDINTRP